MSKLYILPENSKCKFATNNQNTICYIYEDGITTRYYINTKNNKLYADINKPENCIQYEIDQKIIEFDSIFVTTKCGKIIKAGNFV